MNSSFRAKQAITCGLALMVSGVQENTYYQASTKALKEGFLSEDKLTRVCALNEIAQKRGQSLAQLALAWVLRDERVTTALIGASSVAQLEDNVAALNNLSFSDEELKEIDLYAQDADINLWAQSSNLWC